MSNDEMGPVVYTYPVRIPRPLVNTLLHHAQQGGEKEVCGLLAARHGRPTRHIPVPNVAATPTTRYEMDPRAQIAAMRDMRERGEALFAIYHSHPRGAAVPSDSDVAGANYPHTLYLIVSLKTKGILELRGFLLEDGAFREVELEFE